MLHLKLSCGYFQYVNERAADVTVIPVGVDLGSNNSLISPVVRWFSTTGVL